MNTFCVKSKKQKMKKVLKRKIVYNKRFFYFKYLSVRTIVLQRTVANGWLFVPFRFLSQTLIVREVLLFLAF